MPKEDASQTDGSAEASAKGDAPQQPGSASQENPAQGPAASLVDHPLMARLALEVVLTMSVAGVFAELASESKVFDTGDDRANFAENKLLEPLTSDEWPQRFRDIIADEGVIGVWEPTSLVLKLVLAQVFGMKCRTFTGAAVALHAVSCVLAMELCLRLRRLLDRVQRGARVGLLHAWSAALFMGIHPLRVEPLAWASGFPFEISTFFAILSALCHVVHRAGSSPEAEPPRVLARPWGPWRLLSAGFLLLACTSKASALGLIGALGLLDMLLIWEGRGEGGLGHLVGRCFALVVDVLPLALASAVSARQAFMASKGGDPGCKFIFAFWQRLLRAAYMSVLYIVQQIWSHNLCVLHAVPVADIQLDCWRFGGAAAAVAFLALLALCAGPRSASALLAYLAILSPTLGILSDHVNETAADRYCHQSCMLLGVPVLATVLARLRPRFGLLSVGVVLGVAACEVASTWHYVKIWSNPNDTIAQAVRASPRFYRTRYIHGMHLLHSGQLPEAEKHLRESLVLCQNFTNTHFGLTQALMNQRKIPDALKAMYDGVVHAPDNHFGHLNLGTLYQQTGQLEDAVRSFRKAVELNPTDHSSLRNLQAAQVALQNRPGGRATSPEPQQTPPKQPPVKPREEAKPPEPERTSPERSSAKPRKEDEAEGEPYLSIVLASRNDDYAGKLEARFVNHVALMYFQLARSCFKDSEIIVVEWNPPRDSDELGALIQDGVLRAKAAGDPAAGCGWSGNTGPAIRLIRVDPQLHMALQQKDYLSKAPMAEYFAKNIGIRRARGRFVIATNPDTVYSPELIAFLAGRTLQNNTFYTASMRFDIMWPKKFKAPAKYLSALMKRVHDDSKLQGTEYEPTRRFRPEANAPIRDQMNRICASGDDGKGGLQGYWDYQAGDFVIAARERWLEVAGYPEVDWSFGVDSSILCKFFGRGMRTVVLMPPCLVVHQHHRIRENPNARRVMDPKEMCDACKKDPLQKIHVKQRKVDRWGRHSGQHVRETKLLPR